MVKPFGVKRSGFWATTWRVLLLDLLLSLGGRGGLCLEELRDLKGSFSMGGGGVAERGDSTALPSGSCGRSGTTRRAESGQ